MRKSRRWKCFFALMLLILCLALSASAVFARAGGGGSGGGGGGSGGGSHSTSHSHSNGSGRNNPFAVLIWMIGAGAATYGGRIVIRWKSEKAEKRSRAQMRGFSQRENHWDYRKIQKRVKKAYFVIQECWRIGDAAYAEDYLSRSLLEEFQTKLSWMKLKNEEAVQRNVRLLSAVLVDAHNEEGTEGDSLWYLIHGSMAGFYVNRETREVIRGSTKQEDFYEYWRFVFEDGRWVLDKIRQKDEMDLDQFTGK